MLERLEDFKPRSITKKEYEFFMEYTDYTDEIDKYKNKLRDEYEELSNGFYIMNEDSIDEHIKYQDKIDKINLKRNKLNEIIDMVILSLNLTIETINYTHFKDINIISNMWYAYDKLEEDQRKEDKEEEDEDEKNEKIEWKKNNPDSLFCYDVNFAD